MANNDPILHNYQDDLDTDANMTDPIIPELTDDPTEELGVPRDELRRELEKIDGENENYDSDDMREYIEDIDDGE